MSDGKVIYKVEIDDSNVDKDLDLVNQKVGEGAGKSGGKIGEAFSNAMTDKFGAGAEKMSGIANTMGANISSGALIGVAAVGALGIAAVGAANDMDGAMDSFLNKTGKSIDETERYQDVLEDIYAKGYGESFDDIANAMATVNQQMGDMSDEQLQKIVEGAYLLQDTFEIDMNESIRGTNALIKQFGIDGEEAFNLIAQGAQAGLNQNQDLADQLAEYSVYYADMGFSAEEMFNAMANGAETGAFQIDYLNDAMKEFGIRSKDGSTTSMEAFEALGLSAEEMTSKFAEGGEGAREAFDQVVDALVNVEDATLQNQIGVDLFGTKWEDLGVAAVLALTDTEGAIDASIDKLGEMEEMKFDNLGEMFDGIKRSVELLIIPIGEALIPLLMELIEAVLPIFQELLPPIVDAFSLLLEPLLELVGAILPPLIELFMSLLEPLIKLFEQVIPPVIEIFNRLINDAISPLMEVIKTLLTPIIEGLLGTFTTVFEGIADIVGTVIDTVMDIMESIIDFVKNVFTGNWEGAWQNIKDIFDSIFGGIGDIFKKAINTIIDGINNFTSGINKIKIPDWVPVVGGRGFKIPSIPRLKVGMDYVPEDEFPALLHKGEAVLTAEEANIYRALGGNLKNMMSAKEIATASTLIVGGTIMVEGVDTQGQFMGAVELIMDELRREVRL